MTKWQRPPPERRLASEAVDSLRQLLPPEWDVEVEPRPSSGRPPDMVIKVLSPDGSHATFVAEVKTNGAGAAAQAAIEQLSHISALLPEAYPLLVAPWLSARSRDLLTAAEVSYLDATGNARIVAGRPGLFITASGADKNPWPADSTLQSLRGRGAALAIRALVDHRPPYGIRELAERTAASAATLSRVVGLLEGEHLVTRDPKGKVVDLDWEGTLRRWALDYDVQASNDSTAWLAPRGLDPLVEALRSTSMRYALTGSLAAQQFAPYAPARLGMLYVDDISAAAESLDLRPVDSGANVLLLVPFDEVVHARVLGRDGITVVNPSQLAVDLLTSPGRSPSEGEELLRWMKEHVDVWRT
jgi:hypothetical protein